MRKYKNTIEKHKGYEGQIKISKENIGNKQLKGIQEKMKHETSNTYLDSLKRRTQITSYLEDEVKRPSHTQMGRRDHTALPHSSVLVNSDAVPTKSACDR